MMRLQRGLVLVGSLLAPFCLTGAPGAYAQDCVEGMYKIYDGQCHEPEIPFSESGCTHRGTGSEMDPFRCCCPEGYPPVNCASSVAAKETPRPAVTVTVLRAFKHDVLSKHESTADYVEEYYRYSGYLIRLMATSPKLLGRTATLLEDNLPALAKLAVDGRVTVEQSDLDRAVALLDGYMEKASANTGLREVLQRVRRDLQDEDFLRGLGVQVGG